MIEEEMKARRRDYGVCAECRKKGIYKHATVYKIDESKPYETNNLICLCGVCASEVSKSLEVFANAGLTVEEAMNNKLSKKKKGKDAIINDMQ